MPATCDGDDYIEYEIDFVDFIKLTKPPYDLRKRSENGIWYIWFREDGNDRKFSTEIKQFSLAREKAKEIWKDYTEELYAR